jgi:hypothetical protein
MTMARSAYREAAAYFEEALGALAHLPEERAHFHVGLGKPCATVERRVEARAELTVARDLCQTMEMTRWLPQAKAAPAPAAGA